jgi:hypothetical protein
LGFGVLVFGFGVWGLAPNPKTPIPNPQSPIPNPQYPVKTFILILDKYYETKFILTN